MPIHNLPNLPEPIDMDHMFYLEPWKWLSLRNFMFYLMDGLHYYSPCHSYYHKPSNGYRAASLATIYAEEYGLWLGSRYLNLSGGIWNCVQHTEVRHDYVEDE